MRDLGRKGEEKARAFLLAKGYREVVSNFRCRYGEIDLVAADGEILVFVEVKSKRGAFRGTPEEMLTAAKRRRLTLLARYFLSRRRWQGRSARFDVVAVRWDEGGGGRVTHYRDAFPATSAW